jgi:hypothetical protein
MRQSVSLFEQFKEQLQGKQDFFHLRECLLIQLRTRRKERSGSLPGINMNTAITRGSTIESAPISIVTLVAAASICSI